MDGILDKPNLLKTYNENTRSTHIPLRFCTVGVFKYDYCRLHLNRMRFMESMFVESRHIVLLNGSLKSALILKVVIIFTRVSMDLVVNI